MSDYSKYKIKDYKHWSIFIHHNQGYLGRCVVWCNREDALDLTDATIEEQQELFVLLEDLRIAIQTAFKSDWMNYAFLGNETRHLHGHVIPRYEKPRIFEGVTFNDPLWGHNYKTDQSLTFSGEIIERIRSTIANALK